MYEIHVHETFAAPIEAVFDAVSDHERFISGPTIEECRVEKEGAEERNGLGAVRRVRGGGYVFVEDIVGFDRPRRYDYRVVELKSARGRRQPFHHELGWLELTEVDGGTRVDWRSRFRFTIPLLGWALERVQGPGLAKVFAGMLAAAKARVEAEVAAAS